MKLRLRLRLLVKWYLGHFEEVRSLRRIQSQHESVMRELHQELAAAYKKVAAYRGEADDLDKKIHELDGALRIMTEARLNADKHSEAFQRTVNALTESHESAINNLKQTVDCFSLASMGRQVFGTAPSVTRQLDEMAQQPVQAGIQGRKMVQQATQEAMEEARKRAEAWMRDAEAAFERMKQGQAPPDAQPEYSSTARAYSE